MYRCLLSKHDSVLKMFSSTPQLKMFVTRAVSDGVFNIAVLLVMANEWTRAYSQPKTQAFDRLTMERKNVIAQETINTRLCCQGLQGLVLAAQKSPAKGRHNSGN